MNARKVARVHPKTVTALSKGEVREKKRRRAKESGRSSRVHQRNVLDDVAPAARETVRRLADGDLSRVEVLSASEVLIHNPKGPRSLH